MTAADDDDVGARARAATSVRHRRPRTVRSRTSSASTFAVTRETGLSSSAARQPVQAIEPTANTAPPSGRRHDHVGARARRPRRVVDHVVGPALVPVADARRSRAPWRRPASRAAGRRCRPRTRPAPRARRRRRRSRVRVEPREDDGGRGIAGRLAAVAVGAAASVAESAQPDPERAVLRDAAGGASRRRRRRSAWWCSPGQRLPGESLGLVATQLDHVRSVRIDRDRAVEPVAAEVGEAAARARRARRSRRAAPRSRTPGARR